LVSHKQTTLRKTFTENLTVTMVFDGSSPYIQMSTTRTYSAPIKPSSKTLTILK